MKSPSVGMPAPPPPPPPPAALPDPDDILVRKRKQRGAAQVHQGGREATIMSDQPGEMLGG